MNVSLAEVLAGATAHAVPLTAECVGYLVLGAADQVLGAPRCLGARDLVLSEEGAVRVAGGRAASAEDAERDLRALLDSLLLRASGASPGLLRASRRPAGSGLPGLVRELETALIPVNRAAAKRALSRLQRETRRALDSGRIRLDESAPEAAVAPTRAPSVETPAPVVVAPMPAPVIVAPILAPVIVAPILAPVVEESSSEPLPSVALPPVLPPMPSDPVPVPWAGERRDHTLVLAEVAPREPNLPEQPQLVETRPEPVVRRASQRPAAIVVSEAVAPSFVERGHTVPLPPVSLPEPAAAASPPIHTPVLGTRVVAEAEAPGVDAPSAEPPNAEPPNADALSVDASNVDASNVDASNVDASNVDASNVDASNVDASNVDASNVDASNVDASNVDAPSAEPPNADAPSAGAPDAVVAASEAAVALEAGVAEAAPSEEDDLEIVVVEEPAAAEMQAENDDDGFIEVIFEEDERTVFPEDHELLFAAPDERDAGETTDPCPPLAAESMLPPPCELVTAAPPSDVAPSVEALSELPPVAPKGEPLRPQALDPQALDPHALDPQELGPQELDPQALDPRDVELAALVESALPPWSREEAPAFEVTPPPRVALPEPRRSDVAELLLRLGQAPLGVDELRAGLKRLAGMDLTPPPPGTAPGE